MRRFYHFRREKRSVRSQNPLRAPAQSTAFSNRRFKHRAAQKRSSSDSAQPHLQNHAASASQLSMYKASCAGFTTLLRFGIKPAPAQLPRIRVNALQKPSPHKTALPPIPRKPSAVHPSRPQRRIHRIPPLRHQTLRPAQLPRIRANALQKPSPHKTALHPIPRKPSAVHSSRANLPAPDSPHSSALHQIPQSPYNARQSAPALPHARGITGNLSAGGQKNRRTRLDAAVDVTFQAAIRPARRST